MTYAKYSPHKLPTSARKSPKIWGHGIKREKFQVLTDQDETVAPYHEMNEKQGINDVNDDREARKAEAGREEMKSDQELVDCHEMRGSTPESAEETIKMMMK